MSFETRELFGRSVRIQIPSDSFPTPEEIRKIDETTGLNCKHGWYESVSDSSSYKHDDEGKAQIHYRYWLPSGPPKGILVFTHGILSQSGHACRLDGRPLDVALVVDTFTAKGFAVYARDQYGHGFSEGVRFFVPSWKENRDDLVRFVKLVADKHEIDIPLFLSGESYGGCLTLLVSRYFQDFPDQAPKNFDSSLLVCPAIIGDIPPFPITQILRYLLAPIAPTWSPFFMPDTVSADRVWRDSRVCDYYTRPRKIEMGLDKIGAKFRLGTAVALLKALEEARKNAIPGYEQAFLVLHGSDDIAVPLAGSELLVKNASTPDDQREFHVIEKAFHGLLADPAAEEAIARMVDFVDRRVQDFESPK